ncbi:hypothetical protein EXIGLDRAFT_727896 [Exidia glandulosa HHB12029]|uniref:Uncharacterized protein n=1 Tax=Exidia glandulosa HHB12029 TaxID=1314781 RepID=A0A165D6G5_EXIGL|nr:hypothetical protein EXIGLDRAFT_727896 [Exidia glandulosa HHB12029]
MPPLPPELWLCVIETLNAREDTGSLARLARVSKLFWNLVTPFLYHTVRFRRSSRINGLRHGLLAHPSVASHVRILVFGGGVKLPVPPFPAVHGNVFAQLSSLAGVHVRTCHLPNPPPKSSVGWWLAYSTPAVRRLMVTLVAAANFQLPPTPETLHLEHAEYAIDPLGCVALYALRNLSATVCIGTTERRWSTPMNVALFLRSLSSLSNLSRARIFFAPESTIQKVFSELGAQSQLDSIVADARIQLVVHDFGVDGYRKAVYGEMCGDGSFWSLGHVHPFEKLDT